MPAEHPNAPSHATRRTWLRSVSGALMVMAIPRPARGMSADARAWVQETFDGRAPVHDLVSISLPALSENGNSVALGVDAAPGARPGERITQIDVYAEANPVPHIARFRFTPLSGRPAVHTRIRLAASQPVLAIASRTDGALFAASADIVVTEAACLDFLI